MKIYDFEGFPNPARVRIALAEKGITDQFDFITIDVPNGEHRKPEFLAKNPNGAVPVLELDDGTTISECTAITEYIDHTFEGISLTGKTAKQRAIIHMMQRRAEQNLLDALVTYFHHSTEGLGPELETYQNKEWGEKQLERGLEGMHYFDSVLAASTYIAGEDFSMADITVFAGLSVADFIKLDIPNELSNLSLWKSRMEQRSSIIS
jgi:glutathione S-transferase